MAVIEGNEISNTRDTTHERLTSEAVECLDNIEIVTYTKSNKKQTSIVWQELAVVKLANGTEKVQCNHCKIKLAKNKDRTTTQYKRHLDGCAKHQTWKYDQAKISDVVSHMIMVHELPFAFTEYEIFTLLMKIASSHYVRISCGTAKADCWTSYEVEKKRLNGLLKTVDRISITTDMWKSCQKIQYMGIEGKVCSISMDNASYNDAAVRMLKDSLSFHKRLPLNGELFHVRCCAHILNLLVHDGLSEIENRDVSYKYLPNDEDWVRVEEVCSFLALFNEVTNIISEDQRVIVLLMEKSLTGELWMRQMVDKMQRKFDKYLGEGNLLISIAAILDLRNKMKLIDFSFRVIYSEEEAPRQIRIVHDSFYELYKEHVDEYATTNFGT
ncbi:hypothetical protein CXB51_014797 [Gossypium anomalum]|uniref:hAT-like transposase RNase-H fold domain-containing protein n=1 Tax=Gossypium anomalum TaxID=47600 RepID=A0A8J5ZLS3_9ROSI|nr:hypothetical protein CXB51_014797 [Gossypium anomalum]